MNYMNVVKVDELEYPNHLEIYIYAFEFYIRSSFIF